MNDTDLRKYALERAMEVERGMGLMMTAQMIYAFLKGAAPDQQPVWTGNVAPLRPVPARHEESNDPAPADDSAPPEPVKSVETKKTGEPRGGTKLAQGQQDLLDAMNHMDEAGLLPARLGEIAKYMGKKNGTPDISAQMVRLVQKGFVIKEKTNTARRQLYLLAEDEDAEDAGDSEDVDLGVEMPPPVVKLRPVAQESDVRKPAPPYRPQGAARRILMQCVNKYLAEKLIYRPDDLPRVLMLGRSQVLAALKELKDNDFIRYDGDERIIPLMNTNRSPLWGRDD